MEILRKTKIQFMKYRRWWVSLSLALMVLSVAVLWQSKLNLGIDFAGGTQLTVKFASPPEIDRLRDVVADAGIEDAVIQRFGEADDNEVMIRTPLIEGQDEGTRQLVVDALDASFGVDADGRFDLNRRGREALTAFLLERDPDQVKAQDDLAARNHYEEVADSIMERRRNDGLLTDWSEIGGVSGVSQEVLAALRSEAVLGSFSVLGGGNVSPQIGAELRRKGILAILSSLVGMLIYMWYRFELRFGIGALVAVVHDVLVTLGLFTLLGYEFNLTTIAGFLTLVGYSMNDSVVVFDRVRENMRRARMKSLEELMDMSLNQTLSRTVLTSGTTLLVLVTLLLYGGDVLRGFAFILTTGVVFGTYSSIYIASPFTLWWENNFSKQARLARRTAKA